MLFVCHPKILHKHCLRFLLGVKWSQEKLKTILMQTFGVTDKERYGMLWYFLEWSIPTTSFRAFFSQMASCAVCIMTSFIIHPPSIVNIWWVDSPEEVR